MTVHDLYLFLDSIAPFDFQEKYDNSGFLIGDKNAAVEKICLALDITLDVIKEAKAKNAELIISHHPIIFKPISGVKTNTAVYEIVRNNINAICAHTNFDVAIMSGLMLDLLNFPANNADAEVIEVINKDGDGFGRIINLSEPVFAKELAKRCKEVFNAPVVKYVVGEKPIRRIGVCSGSGGGAFDFAVAKNCDAFITGEIKHSLFIAAKDSGVTLIDAGHFYTENFFCEFLRKKLAEKFPQIEVFVAENNVDVCDYLF